MGRVRTNSGPPRQRERPGGSSEDAPTPSLPEKKTREILIEQKETTQSRILQSQELPRATCTSCNAATRQHMLCAGEASNLVMVQGLRNNCTTNYLQSPSPTGCITRTRVFALICQISIMGNLRESYVCTCQATSVASTSTPHHRPSLTAISDQMHGRISTQQ